MSLTDSACPTGGSGQLTCGTTPVQSTGRPQRVFLQRGRMVIIKWLNVKRKIAKSHIHQEPRYGESNRTQENTPEKGQERNARMWSRRRPTVTGREEDQEGFFPIFKYVYSFKTFLKQTVPTSTIKRETSKHHSLFKDSFWPFASMLTPPQNSCFVSGLLLPLNFLLFLK